MPSNDKDDLLPCPACHKSSTRSRIWGTHQDTFTVRCLWCGFCVKECETQSEAVILWNTRTNTRPKQDAIEAMSEFAAAETATLSAQLAETREALGELVAYFGDTVLICGFCNGDGYTAEHGCNGNPQDCENGCPVQAQCQRCQARGHFNNPDLLAKAKALLQGGE